MKESSSETNDIRCPYCNFEQWRGYEICQKCGKPTSQRVDRKNHIRKSKDQLFEFFLGLIGWMIIPVGIALTIANFTSSRNVIMILIHFIGILIALKLLRLNVRWIGIGILCAVALFLIGSYYRGACVEAFVFPFPFSLLSC